MSKSMREIMAQSAAKGLAADFDNDLKRLSARSNMESKPYIMKSDDHLPFITCYMCGSNDCEEIKFGNKRQGNIHVLNLCKNCQQLMAEFLNSGGDPV